MPSHLHEALLILFRNRPSLAPELLRDALHVNLPEFSEVRLDSAELTDIQPAEYRADLVILLLNGRPVLGIVVEAQLSIDDDKRFVWPVYAVNLRARIRCPVCVLVVAASEVVARWATKQIDLGAGNFFLPLVLGPSCVPEIIDAAQARQDPELAVLSAMAHGQSADVGKSLQIALAASFASAGLDAERSKLYFDLILTSLTEAARQALQAMNPAKYEYQSEFAKRYVAQGKAEGKAEGEVAGRVEIVLRQLAARFGTIAATDQALVRNATIEQLDAMAERVLTATTLAETLGPH